MLLRSGVPVLVCVPEGPTCPSGAPPTPSEQGRCPSALHDPQNSEARTVPAVKKDPARRGKSGHWPQSHAMRSRVIRLRPGTFSFT